MASSMVDPLPLKFFLSPIQTCPSNIILRKKTVPPNPMLTLYKLLKSICLRNDIPLGKLNFDNFFLKLQYYLMLLILNSIFSDK